MTKNSLLLLSLLFAITSCQFSKGVKKDLNTGLATSYNGFAIDDIYLGDASGNRLGDNKIRLGSTIGITAVGVDNYEEKDGKVHPGCTIILTDKNKKELLNLPDAFGDQSGGMDPKQATTLTATLNTGNPMVIGETYHLRVRFFDKNKKGSEIVSNVDLVMIQ